MCIHTGRSSSRNFSNSSRGISISCNTRCTSQFFIPIVRTIMASMSPLICSSSDVMKVIASTVSPGFRLLGKVHYKRSSYNTFVCACSVCSVCVGGRVCIRGRVCIEGRMRIVCIGGRVGRVGRVWYGVYSAYSVYNTL